MAPRLGEDLVALLGQDKIFPGESAGVMRGKCQLHLVIPNIYVRVVIELLSLFGDPVDEIEAAQKIFKLENSANGLRPFRPCGNNF